METVKGLGQKKTVDYNTHLNVGRKLYSFF